MKSKYFKLIIVYLVFYVLIFIRDKGLSGFVTMLNIDNLHLFYLTMTSILSFFSYVFLSYCFLLYFYNRDQKTIAWIGVVSVLFMGVLFRYFLEEIVGMSLFGRGNYAPGYELFAYFRDNTYYGQIYLALGVAFFFFQRSSYEENKRNLLIIEQKKSELSFLKSQINPHFLFNTLNNIYALVNKKDQSSLAVIEKLSQLLRYTLYDSKNKVSIEKEVSMIDNFIALHNLRVKNGIQISKSIEIDDPSFEMAPLILLPFLENTIKHGVINDSLSPIRMELSLRNEDFHFSISNKISELEKDEVGGIGLENIKKRLCLLYPQRHSLETKTENNYFVVHLRISPRGLD